MYYIRFILLAVFLILPFSPAEARIDILPRKIVMGPRDRSAEITILNLFNDPSIYRISLIHYRQNPDGTYETLLNPLSEDFDPDEVVRISPRQFQVSPNGRQKIRLSLRKPEDLPEGEYRFHVLAQRFEVEDPNKSQDVGEGASVSMKMNIGVSIPVVVRHGDLSSTSKIENIQFIPESSSESGRSELKIGVSRQGNASSIGKLEVYLNHINGNQREIASVSNFNIFTEISMRSINLPLNENPVGQGSLKVIYKDEEGKIYDEKTFQP